MPSDLEAAITLLIVEVDQLCFALEPPKAMASFIREQVQRVELCLELAALRPYTDDLFGTADTPKSMDDVTVGFNAIERHAKPSA